ncbi:MAG: ribosome recycling factor [Clostridia bacterium]
MLQELVKNTEDKMVKTVDALKKDFSGIRAGRANPSLLDKIVVDYYGVATPVNQLANVSVPEPRLIVLQPWDKSSIKAIEKAILTSDLGLNPSNDGVVIRLVIPQLTNERRLELVKKIKKIAEEYKVEMRNTRRIKNEEIKKMEKEGSYSEDETKKALEQIQKITDKYIEQVGKVEFIKETEILEV